MGEANGNLMFPQTYSELERKRVLLSKEVLGFVSPGLRPMFMAQTLRGLRAAVTSHAQA